MPDSCEQIRQLQEEGRLDSAGRFSLDPELARRQLGEFAMPEKAMYVLKLVQWAVASQATLVEFDIQHHSVSCTHNGQPIGPERFASVLGFSQSQKSRAEHHLQVASAAMLALQPHDLILESLDCISSLHLGPRPHQCKHTRLTAVGLKKERFSWAARSVHGLGTFDIGANTVSDLLSHLGRSEIALLRTHCEGGSIPIWVNGFCVNRPTLGMSNRAERVAGSGLTNLVFLEHFLLRSAFFSLNPSPQPFSLAAPAIPWNQNSRWFWSGSPLKDCLGSSQGPPTLGAPPLSFLAAAVPTPLLWHGWPMLSCDLMVSANNRDLVTSQHNSFHFYDGVLVERFSILRPGRAMHSMTACAQLTLDLGGLRVVHDSAWAALQERVADTLRQIETQGSSSSLPPSNL